MRPRERVLNALAGGRVDRPPVASPTSVATVELMDMVGAPFPQAHRDPVLMARLAETSCTVLGFDAIMPVFSIIQESSALGCDIQWEEKDNWPTVRMANPIWSGPEDITVPADFLSHTDIRCVLDAIRLLKREYGDEVAIIGKTMGPWTLAYHVFGVENFLLMAIDDPDRTVQCLDRLKEVTVLFGNAQIEAGADALTLPDHATGDLVSGEFYRRFLRDIHVEMHERIRCPLILHICGDTLDRLDSIAQTRIAAFHSDSKNDPAKARQIAGNRVSLIGSVNNPETLYTRGPAEVRREVYQALDAGFEIVAPECAIPLQTPLENLREIPRAVRDWARERSRSGAQR
ncbi:MAG: MtaA/CmuA family methyltransferase [Chloroflexi bacterium]|nr:MtaA/CmuA family methyltransferase [Chloroflexota bacterium]